MYSSRLQRMHDPFPWLRRQLDFLRFLVVRERKLQDLEFEEMLERRFPKRGFRWEPDGSSLREYRDPRKVWGPRRLGDTDQSFENIVRLSEDD